MIITRVRIEGMQCNFRIEVKVDAQRYKLVRRENGSERRA